MGISKRERARRRAEEWDQKYGTKLEQRSFVVGQWVARIGFCVLTALAITGVLLLVRAYGG
jgi:hypothetical protein